MIRREPDTESEHLSFTSPHRPNQTRLGRRVSSREQDARRKTYSPRLANNEFFPKSMLAFRLGNSQRLPIRPSTGSQNSEARIASGAADRPL